jgi:hypothetical protein
MERTYEIVVVDELPEPPYKRNLQVFADAARANPGKWIQLPFETDRTGSIVNNLKRCHRLEAKTVKGVHYCRQPI